MYFLPLDYNIVSPPTFNPAKAENPLGSAVVVVINAILEVFFLCLVGWILARRGIVDDKAKKTLNKLNVSLFTPALLFSKVAFSLSPDKLRDLIIIPIGFVIVTVVSAAVAWGLGTVFRLKKGQRNFAVACAMFQNSNSLPIALMQSLIGEKMRLEWSPHDTKDSMLARALSYLVLYSTLGIIVRWSFGVRLLTSAESMEGVEADAEAEAEAGNDVEEGTVFGDDHAVEEDTAPLLNGGGGGGGRGKKGTRERRVTNSTGGNNLEGEVEQVPPANGNGNGNGNTTLQTPKRQTSKSGNPRPQSIFQSFPNTPRTSVYATSSDGTGRSPSDSDDNEEEEDEEWGAPHGVGRRSRDGHDDDDDAFMAKFRVRWKRFSRKCRWFTVPVRKVAVRIGDFMTVPLWAALLSIFVACVPPLQRTLHEAEPLKSAIRNAGNCSVPITLITLGAYFYRPSTPPSPRTPRDPRAWYARLNPFSPNPNAASRGGVVRRGDPATEGETRTVFVAVVSRMILVPAIMLPLFGWYAAATVNVADDPVFVVVACLLIGSPTAITLAQITSSASGDMFEKLISRTLFVSYAFLTAPVTIGLVSAALYIDKLQ